MNVGRQVNASTRLEVSGVEAARCSERAREPMEAAEFGRDGRAREGESSNRVVAHLSAREFCSKDKHMSGGFGRLGMTSI